LTVKIVTDSGSDISPEEARKLGISLVPTYVRFGDEVFRDRVDLGVDDFYAKLVTSSIYPSTAAPSPGDFARVYQDLCKETDEILSIHITRKHSALLEAALLGKEMTHLNGCQIEIMDSGGVTMWQGLVAIAAARAASAGDNLQGVLAKAHETITNLKGLALLDTLKYVVKGGRLAKTIFKVESILNVKALVTIRDGEVRPVGLVRNWVKGIEKLNEFVRLAKGRNIQDIAIVYNTPHQDALNLREYVKTLFPNIIPLLARMGPTLGAHTGPGTIATALVSTKQLNSNAALLNS